MDPSETWTEIRTAYAAADYAQCEALLGDQPATEQTCFWGVRVASRQEQFETVRDRAAAYLADYPPHVEVVQLLARAANKLKDAPLAASSWRTLADLAPDPVDALRQAVRANAKIGNDSFAIAAATRLAAMVDERPDALPAAAAALLELDRFEALAGLVARIAMIDAAAVGALIDTFATAADSRGLAAALAGVQMSGCDAAPPVDRGALIETLLSSGVRRERDGAQAAALNDFRAVLVLSPDDVLAVHGVERLTGKFLGQARALNRIGEFREAIDSLRTMYRSDPANPEIMLPYGRALMNAGELALAEDLWCTMIAASPDLEEAWLQHARALEWLDRPVDAMMAWNDVIERWPSNEEAAKHRKKLSQALFKLGRDAMVAEDPVAAATCMAAIPPDAIERPLAEQRLERIGRLLLKAMRAEYKQRDFAKVVAAGSLGHDIAPTNVDLHRLLGKAASKLRRYALAAATWEHLAAVQDNAEVQIEIARNRLALKDHAAAGRAVAAAATFDPAAEGLADLRCHIEADREVGTSA